MANDPRGQEPRSKNQGTAAAAQHAVAEHKQRTRARILAAATDLLASHGSSGLVMTTLARRAGVSRATLYNYFTDLEGVLEGLVEEQVGEFLDDLDHHLAGTSDPAERLRRGVSQLTAWAGEQAPRRVAPGARPAPPSPALVGRIHRPLGRLRNRLVPLIADACAAGALPPGTDPALAARIVLGLVFGVREQLGPASSPEMASAVRAFVLRGLGLRTR